MSANNYISKEQLLSKLDFEGLKGWEAQKEMAPASRLPTSAYKDDIDTARIAAVIILLYENKGRINFPLILRNIYKGVHSNQIGLPGGKVENADKDLQATAIRECYEEIGAEPEKIKILGKLSEMYIPPSKFLVHPFVAFYEGKPEFIPCDIEVQKIIKVSLDDFVQYHNEPFEIEGYDKRSREVPAFTLSDNVKLWGATAMMLNEFKLIVRKSLNL